MPFPDSADTVRAKAHTSEVKPPILVGITVIALLVIALVGMGVAHTFTSKQFAVEKSEDVAAVEQSEPTEETPASPLPVIVVHISGAVVTPGVYELAQGARIRDGIDAAGGLSADAAGNALNLARILTDGEQVIVPSQEEVEAQASSQVDNSAEGGFGAPEKININTASVEQLDTLPGIGPKTAQKIVADRQKNGPFKKPEDLKRVSGIGDKKYVTIADYICVG